MATSTILPASTKGDTKDFLNRLKEGDDNAFGQMVKENWDKIYNRANSLLSNPQDAEEVAQDTFIRARNSILNLGANVPYPHGCTT